ncbi:MAG: NAD(P)H-hydrate epimerase [Sedimentisphaerales bacterium]|nr:NAD(P)H-hydrate epimerase [Sedimentisphaerales bacterium]
MKKYLPGEHCILMSRDEVRAFDNRAINELGIPGAVLMENAGRSCALFIVEKLSGKKNPKVCLFCGTGNNGGDGFVIARHLFNHGLIPLVLICGQRSKIKGDAGLNLNIIERLGIQIMSLPPADVIDFKTRVAAFAGNADMIVDAIFGTGLEGTPRDEYRKLIEAINESQKGCFELNRPVLAVDIPSGLDCDTGQPLGAAIKANWTVTFAAVKKGLAIETARNYTGEIFVASIGIDPRYKVGP